MLQGESGYNLTRAKLDPMIRELATSTAGVDYLPGRRAHGLEWTGDRVGGVRLRDRAGAESLVSARLVVAADGRGSGLATLAGVRTRTRPHERFLYFAHFRGVELDTAASSQMWFAEPDVRYAFTNEDGLTVLVCMAARERLASSRPTASGASCAPSRGCRTAPISAGPNACPRSRASST